MTKKKEKKKTSYRKLLDKVQEFCLALHRPERIRMMLYSREKMDKPWFLRDLYSKTAAAKTLGWSVELEHTIEGLLVWYVKRPKIPMDWLYPR